MVYIEKPKKAAQITVIKRRKNICWHKMETRRRQEERTEPNSPGWDPAGTGSQMMYVVPEG